jgi:hypothetical protein
MPKDRLAAFSRDDLTGWFNFRGISPAIRKEIEGMLTGLMMMGGTADPMAAAEQAKNITKYLEEGDVLSFSVRIDAAQGVNFSGYSAMKADSEYGRMMAAMKPPTEPLLIGLPEEPVIGAMGSASSGSVPGAKEQMRKGLDQVLNEQILGEMMSAEEISALKDDLINVLAEVDALNISVAGLPAEGGEGMIGVTSVVTVKDSRKWQKQVHGLFASIKKIILKAAKQPDITEDEIKAIDQAIQIKENAEKLGDSPVDHFIVDLSKVPDLTADDIAEVKSVVGKEGILVRIVAVDPTHVAITFGGGKARCQTIMKNITEGKAPLADNKFIKMVADRLPSDQRIAEGYLKLENILKLVIDISNQLNEPFPFPLMVPETAPLCFSSVKVGNNAQQMDFLVPIETIVTIKNSVEPLMGMMMGGMMGGPQGGEMEMEVEPLEDEGELK